MRGYIIHLQSATDREPLIFALKRDISWNLTVFDASNGSEWVSDPAISKKHPWTRQPVSRGVLGCCKSHLDILTQASNAEIAVSIFEDDCVINATKKDIDIFLHRAPPSWDILLLGANEYVESKRTNYGGAGAPHYIRVNRFWGTHALLLRPRAVEAVLRTFRETQAEGFFMPADWLYNEAIRRYSLACYGPATPDLLCHQAPGYISVITGQPR